MAIQKKMRGAAASSFKLLAVVVFIFSLGLLPHPGQGFSGTQKSGGSESVRPDGKLDFLGTDGTPVATIDIEIAQTAEARRKGLMGRTSLRLTEGMLFIFEGAELRYFWMYDTPVSLDMIFVDPEKRIIHIAEATLPMSTDLYSSQLPARYVVEVPAGFAGFFKIKKGMRIQWRTR